MDKKRYELGVQDLYFLALNETKISSTPLFAATLSQRVDTEALKRATERALACYPIFATTLDFSHGKYSLEENTSDVTVADFEDGKPVFFGKKLSGYPFRISADENVITLEWSRVITDAFGARDFFVAILSAYFGTDITAPSESGVGAFLETLEAPQKSSAPKSTPVAPSAPPANDGKKDYSKIKSAKIPMKSNAQSPRVHSIEVSLQDLKARVGAGDISAEAVIIPIFANVLSRRVGEGANVTVDLQLDLRESVGKPSAHNFSVSKTLNYSNSYGKADATRLMKMYDKLIASAKEAENARKQADLAVKSVKPLVSLRPRVLLDIATMVVCGAIIKERSNFSVQNVGKISLPDSITPSILSICLAETLPNAEACISILELEDRAVITLTESYEDESIATDFIGILNTLGIAIYNITE